MTQDRSELERLDGELERLDAVVAQWAPEQRATVSALRSTVEAIQVGALRRLIRAVKDEPGGLDALKKAVQDDWVRAVLTLHGLLRPPEPSIEEKVEAALETVRPALASHSGNVELVRVVSPAEVHIRMIGTCDGCAFSEATVKIGIESAVKLALPTLERLVVVETTQQAKGPAPEPGLVQLRGAPSASPFSRPWQDAGPVSQLQDRALKAVELKGASVLLAMVEGQLKAYPNACTHLGMPLQDGEFDGKILTCPYHAFEYTLDTGECLSAPEMQLAPLPVRTEAGRVLVQVGP